MRDAHRLRARLTAALPHWRYIPAACCRALYGWPCDVAACLGYIESDYAPGTFYPCATCNPLWSRVKGPELSA